MTLPLHPEHLEDLRRSGLTTDTIEQLHFEAVRPADMKLHNVLHAYRLPYWTIDGQLNDFERWKLFPPLTTKDGHTQKYYQAKGTHPRLYLPPSVAWATVASDAGVMINITEGEKKAAKACQERLTTMSVGGVWNWRIKLKDDERLTLPDLDFFNWKGRSVELVQDSDGWQAE